MVCWQRSPFPDSLVGLPLVEQECHVGSACSVAARYHLALCRYLSFVDADGQERTCYPVLAFWIADRKGANALLNVKHWPATFCDTWDLVPKNEMHNGSKAFRQRTAAEMQQVRRLRQASIMHDGGTSSH